MILNTPEDVRELVQKMNQKDKEQLEERNTEMRDWLTNIDKLTGDNDLLEPIAALWSLPDDKFQLLAPTFLNEINKTYNDPNIQLTLAQAYNLRGITQEQLHQEYEQLCNEIDKIDDLSAPKRSALKGLFDIIINSTADVNGIAKAVINIPIELCHESAQLPAYAHLSDAGLDLYAVEDITVNPGETKLIPTGIKVAIPLGYELQVRPKSGRVLRTKLRVANAPGTIDSGYRDEIKVIIDNTEPFIKSAELDEQGRLCNILFGQSYTIGKGEKFAQLVLAATPKVAWTQVESVSMIGEDRGGGFGSSGLK